MRLQHRFVLEHAQSVTRLLYPFHPPNTGRSGLLVEGLHWAVGLFIGSEILKTELCMFSSEASPLVLEWVVKRTLGLNRQAVDVEEGEQHKDRVLGGQPVEGRVVVLAKIDDDVVVGEAHALGEAGGATGVRQRH